jgi:hypothetical protein
VTIRRATFAHLLRHVVFLPTRTGCLEMYRELVVSKYCILFRVRGRDVDGRRDLAELLIQRAIDRRCSFRAAVTSERMGASSVLCTGVVLLVEPTVPSALSTET